MFSLRDGLPEETSSLYNHLSGRLHRGRRLWLTSNVSSDSDPLCFLTFNFETILDSQESCENSTEVFYPPITQLSVMLMSFKTTA